MEFHKSLTQKEVYDVRDFLYLGHVAHFGHENIVKYNDRKTDDILEMEELLVQAWNDTVRPNDTVFHLGDITGGSDPAPYLRRLNGRIKVIMGNHDSYRLMRRALQEGLITGYVDTDYVRWNHERFWLSHYPHRAWRKSNKGSFHLYGHTHGDYPGVGRSMDVGVDAIGFAPISIDEVYELLKDKEFTNHHVYG